MYNNVISSHIVNALRDTIILQRVAIDRVTLVRDLRVIFDSVMSFRPHYGYICYKAHRMLSFVE